LKFKRKARTAEQKRALRRFKLNDIEDVPLDLEDGDLQEMKQQTEQTRVEEELKIDYQVFRSLYWPHFPQNLTKGLGMHSSLGSDDIMISNSSSNRSCSRLE
jgi:hypothetical protein